jgi:gluconate 2-dehydrogenase gamma chain
MRYSSRITRRKFIQVTTAAAAGSMVGCTSRKSPWRFFTLEEGQTVAAICERIIPADRDPGATQAGVVNFIDLQLMGPYKRYRARYRQGIRGVEQTSLQMFGFGFTQLSAERQDEILKELERGGVAGEAWKDLSSKDFFSLILSHAMQGFYGDPRHGGNRERVSWKMLGLPYPPIRGRLHYDLTKPEGQRGSADRRFCGPRLFGHNHVHSVVM